MGIGAQFFLVLLSLTTMMAGTTPANAVGSPFAVCDKGYGTGGAAGNYTIEIRGDGFDRTVTATLRGIGSALTYEAKTYYRPGPQTLYATFDLTKVVPGVYNVIVRRATTNGAVTVPAGLTVTQGGGGTNKPRLENIPARVTRDPNQFYFFDVVWENTGINDALSPVLEVRCSEPFSDDPNGLRDGQGYYHRVFYGLPEGGGPPGILRPGQKGSKTFLINPQPLAPGDTRDITYRVNRLYKDPNAPFDWNSIREDIRPSDMTDEQFGPILTQLRMQVGSTCGDFLRMLSHNASLLGRRDGNPPSWEDCVSVEIAFAQASVGTSILGRLKNNDVTLNIANAGVTALNVETGRVYTTRTLSDGSFVLSIEPGNYTLSSTDLAMSQSSRVSVVAGEPAIVDLPVTTGGELLGKAFLERGAPASDIDIAVSRKGDDTIQYNAHTDQGGRYELSHLPAGTYLVAIPPSKRGWCAGQTLAIADASSTTLDLRMKNTAYLKVNVALATDSKAIANAEVTLTSPEKGLSLRGRTDSKGAAEFYVPAGSYGYEASADGLVPVSGNVVVLTSAQNRLDVSPIAYGTLLVSMPADMNSLIEGIAAVETTKGSLYLGALSDYAYHFNGVVPGVYDILWLGKNGLIGSAQAQVQAGCATTFSIAGSKALRLAGDVHTAESGLRIPDSLGINLGQILVVEAFDLVTHFDSVFAAGKAATAEVEALGDSPTRPYKYPELDIDFSEDLVKGYRGLCDYREKYGDSLDKLRNQRADRIRSMNAALDQLTHFKDTEEVTRTSKWLSILMRTSRLAPLGRMIGIGVDLVDAVEMIRCIGYLKTAQALTLELDQNRGEILNITQPYNRQLEFYESYAQSEAKYMDERAAAAVQKWFALSSDTLVVKEPGEIEAITSIHTLNGVEWTLSIGAGDEGEYRLWLILNDVVSAPALAVKHTIFVHNSGECARVQHPYHLWVHGVMKYIYACGGGFEHVPASLEGPVGVFSMSIELCNGGSSGNGPIVIPIPGDIPGGSNQGPDVIIDPGEDDDQVEEPDDSGESDDGSNGEEPPPPPDSGCPQGMFPYPFPDSESGQYCIDCIQAQTLFCEVVSEYIRDIEDINKQLAAGGFPESASQAAIAKANYNIGIVCQLWHDYRCDEATGLDPVTIVKGCCPGCEALFLLWSLDGTE